VRDGANGLLVPPHDRAALGAAIARLVHEPDLAGGLRARAAASVASLAPERLYAELEATLTEAASGTGR
jgi:glycosyltransferase involved in cell wall biosynthesis